MNFKVKRDVNEVKDVEMKIFWKKMDFFWKRNFGSCGLSFLKDCIERE